MCYIDSKLIFLGVSQYFSVFYCYQLQKSM